MRMLITVALLANARAQDVVFPKVSSEECTAQGGGQGRCLDIRFCPALRDSSDLVATLKTLSPGCGFSRFSIKVCCPMSLETSSRFLDDISPPNVSLKCGESSQFFEYYSDYDYYWRDEEEFNQTDQETEYSPGGTLEDKEEVLSAVRRKRANVSPQVYHAVGAVAAPRNGWPWMALIGEYTPQTDINWFCGGVLINEQWVLSALHCFLQKMPEVVRLGEHDYNDNQEETQHEDLGVSEVLPFPEYTHPHAYHDLVLLRLNDTVKFKMHVKPVCLPWGNENRQNLTGEQVTLTGWGDTLFGGYPSPVLQEVDLTVFPSSLCDSQYSNLPVYRDNWPRGIKQETICAGHSDGGKDACRGDSGGPIVHLNSEGRYSLAGIVSKGHGCGHKDYLGLYVNINQPEYLKWIKSVAF